MERCKITQATATKVAQIVSGITDKTIKEYRKSLGINAGDHIVLSEEDRSKCNGYLDYQRISQALRGDIVKGVEKNENVTDMQRYAMSKMADYIIKKDKEIADLNKKIANLKSRIQTIIAE